MTTTWTPDGQALIIATKTKKSVRLMVWHRANGTLSTAARALSASFGTHFPSM